jgi:hypothetical protein
MSPAGMRLVAVMVCAVGCGGGVAIEDYGDALADAFCERFARCGGIESRAVCREILGDPGSYFIELQHAVADGSVIYDEEAMEECLDALASASCDRTAANARVEPQACRDALRGTVADGGACAIGAQCISGGCDNPSCGMACCTGTCEPTVTEAAIGQACGTNTARCVEGAFCNVNLTCQALLRANEPCIVDAQCGYGLYCEGTTDTCKDAPNVGDACPADECADLGTYCNAAGTCARMARRGERCEGSGGCVVPNLCNPGSLTCVPPPGVGQPCDFVCAVGAYCEEATDTCVALKADGQPCQVGDECASNFCDEATALCGRPPVCI